MDGMWERVGTQLLARVTGPMKFRLVLQPCTAAFFAIRSGIADAKAGRPPYFWELISNPPERADMVKEAWKRIGKLFILAMVLDAVYQLIQLQALYFGEMVIVAFVLAIVPYVMLRGPAMRVARLIIMRRQHDGQPPATLRKVS
jgi:predicted LPLAT superfamily acyltransferase